MQYRDVCGVLVCVAGLAVSASGSVVVRSAAGSGPGAIQSAVDQFRTDLSLGGVNNGNGGGPLFNGRREITWDGGAAFDQFASPNLMPADFFNRPAALRGGVFTSPGGGVVASQRVDTGGNLRFGDINPQYASIFQTFSAPRLFAARNSTVIDTSFFVPSDPTTPATVFGFGAVFCDVDSQTDTYIDLFDQGGTLLHRAFATPASNGLSFVGVFFDGGERVARVRLNLGNAAMSALNNDGFFDDLGLVDVVATDDFLYSEPQAVPAPAGAAVLGLLGAAALRRRR